MVHDASDYLSWFLNESHELFDSFQVVYDSSGVGLEGVAFKMPKHFAMVSTAGHLDVIFERLEWESS
jgi:hypothetical protein